MDLANGVLLSLKDFWSQFVAIAPSLITALLLLGAGWVGAKLLRRLTIRILTFLRVDLLAEKSGIEDFLLRGGVRYTTVTLLGGVVYWLFLLAIVLALLNGLGLGAAERLFDRVILFIPNVVVAIVVLMFGSLFANALRGVVASYLNNIGVEGAEGIAAMTRYAILIFVVSVALEQLALESRVIVAGFEIAFGGLCLALAIAFGLGGRDWAARVLDRAGRRQPGGKS